MKKQESFSRSYAGFSFIFFPKAWTMPNLNIRHNHSSDFHKKTHPLDENRKCTRLSYAGSNHYCNAICTDDLIRQAFRYVFPVPNMCRMLTDTVTFKNPLLQLSQSWYVRSYTNTYTHHKTRYIFYHKCSHINSLHHTYTKGLYDHLMKYFPNPNACQSCGEEIPKGVLMAVSLQKANIKL